MDYKKAKLVARRVCYSRPDLVQDLTQELAIRVWLRESENLPVSYYVEARRVRQKLYRIHRRSLPPTWRPPVDRVSFALDDFIAARQIYRRREHKLSPLQRTSVAQRIEAVPGGHHNVNAALKGLRKLTRGIK